MVGTGRCAVNASAPDQSAREKPGIARGHDWKENDPVGRSRVVLLVILVAVGAIFVGEGTGLLRGSSVMVGDSRWAWIGGALVIAGLVLGASALVRRRG